MGIHLGHPTKSAREAYQRRFHIVKQTRPRNISRARSSNKDIIDPGKGMNRHQFLGRGTQATFRPVANDG